MSRTKDDQEEEALPAPDEMSVELLAPDLALLCLPVPSPRIPQALTEAEQDIALQVYAGLSNEEIARSRQVSAKTVGNQLDVIYRKLGVSSRVELVLVLGGRRREAR